MPRPIRRCFFTIVVLALTISEVGCWPNIKQTPNQNGGTVGAGQYYVTGRYLCVYVSDGSDAGSCDITARDNNSCQGAYQALAQFVASLNDVCTNCPGPTNNDKRYSGSMSYIQGGPCSVSASATPDAAPFESLAGSTPEEPSRSETWQLELDTGLLASDEKQTPYEFSKALLPGDRDLSITLVHYFLNQDSPPKVITIPAASLNSSISAIKSNLDSASDQHSSLAIKSIIEKLPINTDDSSTLDGINKLRSRGSLSFDGKTVQNDGKQIELHLQDRRIGDVTVQLPSHVSASVTRSDGVLRFTLIKPLIVLLKGLEETNGIASNQRLQYIELSPAAVGYGFESASLGDKLILIINFSKGAVDKQLQPLKNIP